MLLPREDIFSLGVWGFFQSPFVVGCINWVLLIGADPMHALFPGGKPGEGCASALSRPQGSVAPAATAG